MFITFEGVEGSGKSTQIQLLADHLTGTGHEVVVTREPGGTVLGDAIRNLLLDPRNDGMERRAEVLLYAASRAQLIEEVIQPAISAGKIVLCDRYVDSTVAYQCYGRKLDKSAVLSISDWASDGLMPNLTILIQLDPAAGLARSATGETDRIESESIEFHRAVADGYACIAESDPRRVIAVDGAQPVSDIHRQIAGVVQERLASSGW